MEHKLFVCLDSTLQIQMAMQIITYNIVTLIVLQSKLDAWTLAAKVYLTAKAKDQYAFADPKVNISLGRPTSQ